MALEDEMFMMLEYEIEEERRKREEAEQQRAETEVLYEEAQKEIARLKALLQRDGE